MEVTSMSGPYSPENVIATTRDSIRNALLNLEVLNIGEAKAILHIVSAQLDDTIDNINETKKG